MLLNSHRILWKVIVNDGIMVDPAVVRDYVTEQRSFLKSFVERIEVGDSEAKMYYTIPVPPQGLSEETTGLLPFMHHG